MGIISLKAAKALGIDVPANCPVIPDSSTSFASNEAIDQALWLCRWIPRSLNKMLGHHMARHRLKSQDRTIVGLQFKFSGITPLRCADAVRAIHSHDGGAK